MNRATDRRLRILSMVILLIRYIFALCTVTAWFYCLCIITILYILIIYYYNITIIQKRRVVVDGLNTHLIGRHVRDSYNAYYIIIAVTYHAGKGCNKNNFTHYIYPLKELILNKSLSYILYRYVYSIIHR